MPRQRLEQRLQQQIACYLAHSLDRQVFWSAFPAGGGGSLRGAFLKGMGLRAGCPDILFVWKGIARWMEIKTAKGKVSEKQMVCHALLRAAGSDVAIVRSLEDVEATLVSWGYPLRAHLAGPHGALQAVT